MKTQKVKQYSTTFFHVNERSNRIKNDRYYRLIEFGLMLREIGPSQNPISYSLQLHQQK